MLGDIGPRILVVLSLVVFVTPGKAMKRQADEQPFDVVPCAVRTWTEEPSRLASIPGARLLTGHYDGGQYVIEIPTNWNGELVLWAHGNVNPSNPGGTVLRVQNPALREHWIRNGFAWAASSYRCNGAVTGVGLFDMLAVRDLFTTLNDGRAPTRTYLNGVSLGGRIAMLGLREFPSVISGALAQCPAGQETNDTRVAIAAVAELITGVSVNASTIHQDLNRMVQVLGRPPSYTAKGRQLASIQIELTGGPRPFAMEGLAMRFIDNIRFGVTNTPDAIVRAATNTDIRYSIADGLGLTSAALNMQVARKYVDPQLRSRTGPFRELAPFDGRITRPLLTIQGTGDLQVPVSQQQALAHAVRRQGTDHLLVQRLMRIPGHCRFTAAEERRAFDDLVSWVRTGVRPEGDDVLGPLEDAGLRFTEPLRPGDPGTKEVTRPRSSNF